MRALKVAFIPSSLFLVFGCAVNMHTGYTGVAQVPAKLILLDTVGEVRSYKYLNDDSNIAPEFSGLALVGTRIYAHDQDGIIYRIKMDGNYMFTDSIIKCHCKGMEGVSYGGRNFYGVNEDDNEIYKFTDSSGHCLSKRITKNSMAFYDSVFDPSKDKNARLEGLAYVSDGTFLLAWERQPRGLALVKIDADKKMSLVQSFIDKGKVPGFAYVSEAEINNNTADCFTDVCIEGTLAYVLDRQQERVYVMDYKATPMVVKETWLLSYRDGHKRFLTRGGRGLAEGLAIDKATNSLYIILDTNNHSTRAPIFFTFQIPKSQ